MGRCKRKKHRTQPSLFMVYIYIYVYVYELTQSKEREIKVYNITYIFNLLNLNMACGIPKTFQVMAGSHLGLHTSLRVTETSWDSPKHREKLPVTPRGGCEIDPGFRGIFAGRKSRRIFKPPAIFVTPPKKKHSESFCTPENWCPNIWHEFLKISTKNSGKL